MEAMGLISILAKLKEVDDKGIIVVTQKQEKFLSYKELFNNARNIGQILLSKGINKRNEVIIAVESSYDFINLFWGCVYIGAIPVPMPISEIKIKDNNRIITSIPFLKNPFIISSGYFSSFELVSIDSNEILKESQNISSNLAPTIISEDKVSVVQFSSGSTNKPKGVALSSNNIIENLKIKTLCDEIKTGDVLSHWMPYFHDYGLFGNHLLSVYNGITEIKIESYSFLRDPIIWIKIIDKYRVSICGGCTPTGLQLLIDKVNKLDKLDKYYNLSSVKSFSVGAEMIPSNLFYKTKLALEQFGFDMNSYRPGYGMAECTLIVCMSKKGEGDKTIRLFREEFNKGQLKVANTEDKGIDDVCEFVCVGKPINTINIRISNDNIPFEEPFKIGEIELNGTSIMDGYYNNEEATKSVFSNDGWLKTGDIGLLDGQGRLYITGRKKEIIIYNGHNFYPFDLEGIVINTLGDKVSKSIFASYYSEVEEKENILHFIVPSSKDTSSISFGAIVKESNAITGHTFGIVPDYSIKIRKGDIIKTSSGKVRRFMMCENFINGQYCNVINKKEIYMNNITDYNDIQKILNNIWRKTLDINRVETDDNFYSLGGDSIRTIHAMSQVEDYFNIKLSNRFFYDYPVFENQVDYIKSELIKKNEIITDEYELLARDVVFDFIGKEIPLTENLIRHFNDFKQLSLLYDYLTDIFKETSRNDIECLKSIREIGNFIRKEYSSKNNTFPLMDFQETLFYHNKGFVKNEPTGLSCYIICRTTLRGDFDINIWNKSLKKSIIDFPMLRAVIDESLDEPSMRILDPSSITSYESYYLDISNYSEKEQIDFFNEHDKKDHNYRFDLNSFPLFYCKVYKTGDKQHEIIIHIDHQLVDGFSFFQLIQAWISYYDNFANNITPSIMGNKQNLLFSDYVHIDNLRKRTNQYKRAMESSLSAFVDLSEKINIPTKVNPAILQDVHFNTLHTKIEANIMDKLSSIASSDNTISLNSLLMACYFKVMNLWTGKGDLIINMPIYNRGHHLPNARNVLGSFLDIFPVRLKTSSEEPILQMARKIESFVQTILEYPISSIDLSRKIAQQEGLKQGSLSGIIFSNSIHLLPKNISTLSNYFKMDTPKVQTGAPGTYIDLVIYTWENEWCFDWNYVTELFDDSFIVTLSNQFQSIVKDFTDNRKNKVNFSTRNYLPTYFSDMLEKLNNTHRAFPLIPINKQIENIINKYPTRLAISDEENSFNYKDFFNCSSQLSHLLKKLGTVNNVSVALLLDRTCYLPIAQFSILLSGGFYVPIDPGYPTSRIEYMLQNSKATILITQKKFIDIVESVSKNINISNCILLDMDSIDENIRRVKSNIFIKKDIQVQPCSLLHVDQDVEDLMYMIYTSGSTGIPKGTMITHRNVSNFLNYERNAFDISEESRFALVTSYAFDMTVTSNWLPFICGASLHLLSDKETKDIEKLLNFISNRKITLLNITPSHFSMLVNTLEFLEYPIDLVENMTILLGAELINVSDVNRWLKRYPKHKIINEYGPTEATVASTFYPIPVNKNSGICESITIPIGKPIDNTQIYILDKNKELSMPGVPGILYLGGAGVAKGYFNNEEKTSEVFIVNPLTGDPNDIIYNTGDLVKIKDDGNIVFIGRKDSQVNVRGYRIELGEIESVLSKHSGILDCCATIQQDHNKELKIVAFYIPKESENINQKELLLFLEKKLPPYMVPSAIEQIDKIPMSINGKIEKNKLPNISSQPNDGRKISIADLPKSEMEKNMVKIWERILGIPVGINDNFWEMGGDSIRSVRLIKEIKEEVFEYIKLKDIFSTPTIASMCEMFKDYNYKEKSLVLPLKIGGNEKKKILCLPYAAGTPAMYSKLSTYISDDISLYSVQYPGHGNDMKFISDIDQLGTLILKELDEKYFDSDFYILGYSYGGYVAYDLCKKLEEKGRKITGVIFIGTTPPGMKDELMSFYDEIGIDILQSHINIELNMLSDEEKKTYLLELQKDTDAMIKYKFSDSYLRTPCLSIVGREDEDIIVNNQDYWGNFFSNIVCQKMSGGHLLIKDYAKELVELIKAYIND